jgi:benzoyl-CoA reductase/2-hydroxyglutaryl-CoA dehydratase subunit BcrC/BadD/HgdB
MITELDYRSILDNPLEYCSLIREGGKKVIASFCSYFPEEVILAAGAHPLRLFPAEKNTSPSDRYMQGYVCSVVRSAMTLGLSERTDCLDGLVVPHACDSYQRLSDLWRCNIDIPFFSDVVFPSRLDSQASGEYLVDILKRFAEELSSFTGEKVTEESLAEAIRLTNGIRKELTAVREKTLRGVDVPEMKTEELFKLCMILDRKEALDLAASVNRSMERAEPLQEERPGIMLTGSVCDIPEIYRIIEEAGARVVLDDTCSGFRPWQTMIPERDDPWLALSEYYRSHRLCASKHYPGITRYDDVARMARESGAEGVIFVQMKYCEPYAFDYPYSRESLDTIEIPSLNLEVEQPLSNEGQVRTRIETLIQMLEM